MTSRIILTHNSTIYYCYIRYFLLDAKIALYMFKLLMDANYCLLGFNNEINNEKYLFNIKIRFKKL